MAASPSSKQITHIDVTLVNGTKGPVLDGDGSGDTYLGLHISESSDGTLEITRDAPSGEPVRIAAARSWAFYVLTVQP